MKKYTATVQAIYRLLFIATFITAAILSNNIATAQSINVTVNVLPPYSPYYTDYTNAEASKTLLTLQNLTGVQQKIKLTGKLQGDNGVQLSTRRNYVPLQPIILNPHEIKQLNGLALKNVFDINNLNVIGIDAAKIARSTRIPEGNYTLCIQAADYNTGTVLSATAPLGCTTITITNPEPPVLVGPFPREHIGATRARSLTFNWVNPGNVPFGVQYKLEIAEMPDISKDPTQVLNATSFPVLSTLVGGTSYLYNAGNVPLKPGKTYAWRVTSIDPNKRVVFRNNGVSPASVFTFDPDDSSQGAGGVLAGGVGKFTPPPRYDYSVSGSLTYRYRDNGSKYPPDFPGQRDNPISLKNTAIQLCYGTAVVKMHFASKTVQLTDAYIKEQKEKYNIQLEKTITVTDSISSSGQFDSGVFPQYDGVPVATTQTDSFGNYQFNFNITDKPCRIIQDMGDGTALIKCYYINVVNKHYTDPREYIYTKQTEGGETSTVIAGAQNVFAYNYDLQVIIDRTPEGKIDEKMMSGVSVEGNANEDADVYVLRKGLPPASIPSDDADNIGKAILKPCLFAKQYFAGSDWYIVAKRKVHLEHGAIGNSSVFFGSVQFNNMVDDLNADETYWIYAEYPKNQVYFQPVELSHNPPVDDEYQPYNQPGIHLVQKQLQPTYEQMQIKGVLKYSFADGTAKPLANIPVILRWISYTVDANKNKVYDFDNKKQLNETYGYATTGPDGFFKFDPGLFNYDQFEANDSKKGWSQFIEVESPYYGSPDKPYQFEQGKVYNIGEVVAHVRSYLQTVRVQGKNNSTGNIDNLPGQRVYLCRRADANANSWGVPSDEGNQNSLPLKNLIENNVNYRVISYAETDADGLVRFPRMVVPDINNSDDSYYTYSESGVLSELNYSTEDAIKVSVANIIKLRNPAIFQTTLRNSIVDQVAIQAGQYLSSIPQTPFIDGAVYPQSNTNTNALNGVTVVMYDMSPNYAAKLVDDQAATEDIDKLMYDLVQFKLARYQDYQNTSDDNGSRFTFNNPVSGDFTGWKLLTYYKDGFISGYSIINSGKPMGSGVKENVKGFLLPPRLLHVLVMDSKSKAPVRAKIIVGSDFSWQKTKGVGDPETSEEATLTSSYGEVKFTVVPEDNVNYHAQTFTRTIVNPYYSQIIGKTYADEVAENIDPFLMDRPVNVTHVCVVDALTGKPLAAQVSLTGLPPSETPKSQNIKADDCALFNFHSNASQYGVRVTSPGRVTQDVQLYPSPDAGSDIGIKVEMPLGVNIRGYVTLDGQPVGNAKVYIKELAAADPDASVNVSPGGEYYMSGLPKNNNLVTVVAIVPGSNAIAKTKVIALWPAVINGVEGGDIKINFDLTTNNAVDITQLYGFPLDVESLTQKANGNYILNGRIKINPNPALQAKDNSYLTLKDIEVKAVPAVSDKVKKLHPKPPFVIEAIGKYINAVENTMDVLVYSKYPATFTSNTGLQIVSRDLVGFTKGSVSGQLLLSSDGFNHGLSWGGTVNLIPKAPFDVNVNGLQQQQQIINFNQNQINIPIQNTPKPGTDDDKKRKNVVLFPTEFDVFRSAPEDVTFTQLSVTLPDNKQIKYTLNNIYDVDAASTSYLGADGLHLLSTIHTNITNVNIPDINLDAGDIHFDDQQMFNVDGKSDLIVGFDSWKLQGKWYLRQGNISVYGNLFAGSITLPVNGMEVSNNNVGYGDIQIKNVGIAGVYQMQLDQDKTLTSFGYDKAAKYGTLQTPLYGCWSLSLLSKDATQPVTKLTKLDDLDPNDAVSIMNISLYSKGDESRIVLMQNHPSLTLNGFTTFTPYEIENGSNFFKINGSLELNIPALTGMSDQVYSLMYQSDGAGHLVHKPTILPSLSLVTNGVKVAFDIKGQIFTKNQLLLPGKLQDKDPNSPYTFMVALNKTLAGTEDVTIIPDKSNVISMGDPQQLTSITGTMTGDKKHWNNFTFEGDVVGADGMRDSQSEEKNTKKTHMGFEVKGDLVANKQQIGVKNLSFGDVSNAGFTYDFDKKAIVGSFHLDEKTPNAIFHTDFELQMGSGEWFVLGVAKIDSITAAPVNGASGAVLIGAFANSIPPEIMSIVQSQFHDGVVPDDFHSRFDKLHGCLIVAAIDMNLPIIPDINLHLGPIANVSVEKGIYANLYTSISFDSGSVIINGGIKVGAYVKLHASASVLVGCAGLSLSAEVNGLVSEHLVLPKFSEWTPNAVDLLTKTSLTISAEAHILLSGDAYVGFGVCDADCSSIKVLGYTIPPGCTKAGISKSLDLGFGIDLFKDVGSLTPDRADIWLLIFGDKHVDNFQLPHLSYKPRPQ